MNINPVYISYRIAIKSLFYIISGILLCPVSFAEQLKLDVSLAHPVLLADRTQTTYLKISLTGLMRENAQSRAAVNLALVLDKSGSMSGDKIHQAKQAALKALEWLNNRDIAALITYDSEGQVLVPATKLTNTALFTQAIERLQASGNTALFAGVNLGAKELRKFLQRNQVNRIILLSDGQANVGPSTPQELAQLGRQLGQEGITVTTIGLGLGYNEDLMAQLASYSDGNHAFVEQAADLTAIFQKEFGDVLSAIAQDIQLQIDCAAGIRPLRLLNRPANIQGQQVTAALNSLYSQQEKYWLLELEIPPTQANTQRPIATVKVRYANLTTRTTDQLSSQIAAAFNPSEAIVAKKTNPEVMATAVQQIATQKNEQAVELRDAGKITEAKALLKENAILLEQAAKAYNAPALANQSQRNQADAEKLTETDWNKQRKLMRQEQHKAKTQQSY